jgi:hypothetical protein
MNIVNEISNDYSESESRTNKKAVYNTPQIIPMKDEFFMSDIEKYFKYGIFPYNFFLHIFLTIATTALVLIYCLIYIDSFRFR